MRLFGVVFVSQHRTVYEQLSNFGESEQRALYRERAEQLENNIRLCKYKRDRLASAGMNTDLTID